MTPAYAKQELPGASTLRRMGSAWRGAMLAVLVAAVFAAVAQPASAAGFCESKIVRDYAKPFEGLPELREVTFSDGLPFGPAQLTVGEIGPGTVITGGGKLGYTVEYDPRAEAATRRLNWTIAARLVRISPEERKRSLIFEKVRRVERLRPGAKLSFRIQVSARTSLYRIELDFRRADGRRI